jgi:hypothetical protein
MGLGSGKGMGRGGDWIGRFGENEKKEEVGMGSLLAKR